MKAIFSHNVLILSGSLLLIPANSALAGSEGAPYVVSVGAPEISAAATFDATGQNSSTTANLALSATGNVTLFSQTKNLESLNAGDYLVNNVPTASVSLTVAGYTVYSNTVSVSKSWSASTSQTFVSASTVVVVPVGPIPVPVTIAGSIGGTGSINLSAALNVNTKNKALSTIGLSGNASVGANGTASATIGASILGFKPFSAGLTADLQLLTTTLSANANIGLTTMSGNVNLAFSPINIDLSFVATLLNHTIFSDTFYTYSAPSKTINVVTFH